MLIEQNHEQWTQARRGRAALFAAAIVAVAVLAVWSTGAVWVIRSPSPTASCEHTGTDTPATAPVTAAVTLDGLRKQMQHNATVIKSDGCFTGWNVVSIQDATAANTIVGSYQAASTARIPTTAQMPSVVAFLVAAAAVAAIGCMLRNGVYIIVAVIPWWLANAAVSDTKTALLFGQAPATITFGSGFNVISVCVSVTAVLLIAGAVFVIRVNQLARNAHRKDTGQSAVPRPLAYMATALRVGAAAAISAHHSTQDDDRSRT